MSRSEVNTLEQSLTELYNREKEYQEACNNDAEAEHAFKIKQAREYLTADGSIEARKATALINCDTQYLQHLKTKAVRDFTKEKLRDSQQALSARQSLLSFSAKSDQGYSNDKRVT